VPNFIPIRSGFWFCRGSNFGLSHRNEVSPLTQGLNYRSACDINFSMRSQHVRMTCNPTVAILLAIACGFLVTRWCSYDKHISWLNCTSSCLQIFCGIYLPKFMKVMDIPQSYKYRQSGPFFRHSVHYWFASYSDPYSQSTCLSVVLSFCLSFCHSVRIFKMLLLRQFLSK